MTLKKTLLALIIISFTTSAFGEDECFEKASRAIFKFNEGLDRAIIAPVAKGYNKLPKPIKKGTSNFTSNIATLLSIPNQLLQGNIEGAGHSLGSFMINTSIGILGLADVASTLGVKDTKEDLSQTLGVYGVKGGCYFVIPVLGPSTARDAIAMIGDTFIDPFATVLNPVPPLLTAKSVPLQSPLLIVLAVANDPNPKLVLVSDAVVHDIVSVPPPV